MTQTDGHKDPGMQSNFRNRYNFLTLWSILVFNQWLMILLRKPWQISSTEKHGKLLTNSVLYNISCRLNSQHLTYLQHSNSKYETRGSKGHLEPQIVPSLSQNHSAPWEGGLTLAGSTGLL